MKVSEARTMIYMPKSLLNKCRARARNQHCSTAFLIRDAIQAYLSKPSKSAQEEWKEALHNVFGIWKDRWKSDEEVQEWRRSLWVRRDEKTY